MSKHGLGEMNDNGERFMNNLAIGKTIFPRKIIIYKMTWTAPGHTRKNQNDHIAVSRRWKSPLLEKQIL